MSRTPDYKKVRGVKACVFITTLQTSIIQYENSVTSSASKPENNQSVSAALKHRQ